MKKSNRSTKEKESWVIRNQLTGMMMLALGVGALVVLMRYLIVARQMPIDVMEIEPTLLVPGVTNY